MKIPDSLGDALACGLDVATVVILVVVAAPPFVLILPLVGYAYYRVQQVSRNSLF